MRSNVNILTAAGQVQLTANITGYTDLVAAHVGGDWGVHNQFRFYLTPYAEFSTGHTIIDGYLLRVQLSGTNADGSGDGVFTLPAILTGASSETGGAPIIVVQPVPKSTVVGAMVTFNISAISSVPVTYQWRKTVTVLGVPTTAIITGATASALVLTNVQLADSGTTYSVQISNSFGSVISNSAALTVTAPSSGGGGGDGCFTGDTFITLSNGAKKQIKDIVVGDKVKSYAIDGLDSSNENAWIAWETKSLAITPTISTVVQVFKQSFSSYYQIRDLSVTYEHPLLTQRNGIWRFRRVIDIKAGDFISQNGTLYELETPNLVQGKIETWNLNVEDSDVFEANGIIAHNSYIKN